MTTQMNNMEWRVTVGLFFPLSRVCSNDICARQDESLCEKNQKEPRWEMFCIFSDVFCNIRQVGAWRGLQISSDSQTSTSYGEHCPIWPSSEWRCRTPDYSHVTLLSLHFDSLVHSKKTLLPLARQLAIQAGFVWCEKLKDLMLSLTFSVA